MNQWSKILHFTPLSALIPQRSSEIGHKHNHNQMYARARYAQRRLDCKRASESNTLHSGSDTYDTRSSLITDLRV